MDGISRWRILLALPISWWISSASLAAATSASAPHVRVELAAERSGVRPGETLDLGLHFALEKGWHIYWNNPGDSGEPPRVEWHLPAGFWAGPIQWPAPERIEDHSLIDYGYRNEVLLVTPVHCPAALEVGSTVNLAATANWLVCKEVCLPGQANLALSLPAQKEEAKANSRWQEVFAQTQNRLPKSAPKGWKVAAVSRNDRFILSVRTGSPESKAIFFPFESNQIENAAPQEVQQLDRGLRLTLQKSDQLQAAPSHLRGVVVFSSGRAFVINAPVISHNSGRRSD